MSPRIRLVTSLVAALALLVPLAAPALAVAPAEAPTAEILRFKPTYCDAYGATRVETTVTNTGRRHMTVVYYGSPESWDDSTRSSIRRIAPGHTRSFKAYLDRYDTRLELWQVPAIFDPSKLVLLDVEQRPTTMDCSDMDVRTSYGAVEPETCTVEQLLDNSRSTGPVIFQVRGGPHRVEGGDKRRVDVQLTLDSGLGDLEPPTTYRSWSVKSAGSGDLGESETVPLECDEPLPADQVAGTVFELGPTRVFEATIVVPDLGVSCAPAVSTFSGSYDLRVGTRGDAATQQGHATVTAFCDEGVGHYHAGAETWGDSDGADVAVGDVLAVRIDEAGVRVRNLTSGDTYRAVDELVATHGFVYHYRGEANSVAPHDVTGIRVGGSPLAEVPHRLVRAVDSAYLHLGPLDVEVPAADTIRFVPG